jgi:glycosyltransferase involved in cell wall biosynthesis
MYSYSLVIPAYNEYENLKIILPNVLNLDCEIIVIDPGTNDGTKELCKKYGVKYIRQLSTGKGNALVEAVEHASTSIVCFLDADLAHNPKLIKKLVTPIICGDALHVSGSRMLGGSSELFADVDHFVRLLGSLIINYLISFKFKYKMTDCQNGFRAINKEFFKSLKIKSEHTTIEQELVGKTLASGNIVLELPAHEYSRISGSSKINVLKHGSVYIKSLFQILFMKRLPIDKNKAKLIQKKYSYNWWEEIL